MIKRLTPIVCLVLAAASPVLAHSHAKPKPKPAAKAPPPESVGVFGDWQAATHTEAGETVCYAFSRPKSSAPALTGRGDVVLTVTERPKLRDTVALSAGFAYPANAAPVVAVDGAKSELYSSGRSAFARDGGALIAAMEKGNFADFSSPAAKGKSVTDRFSLKGFGAAMKAVLTLCPDGG